MEHSSSAPDLTRDVIGDLQTELDDPTAPLTTEEVAIVWSVRNRPRSGISHPSSSSGSDGHGGEIRVESEPGDGSTFSFTLPTSDE